MCMAFTTSQVNSDFDPEHNSAQILNQLNLFFFVLFHAIKRVGRISVFRFQNKMNPSQKSNYVKN